MIKFKVTELREIENIGQCPVTHDISISPQDVKQWDIQTIVFPKPKKVNTEETDEIPTELITERRLFVTMRDKYKEFDVVEVPRFKKVAKELEIHTEKEVREVEKHVMYSFGEADLDEVLIQLEKMV